MFGYDYNRDGIVEPDNGSGISVDFLPMSSSNIGTGGQTPFTLEAVICPNQPPRAGNQKLSARTTMAPPIAGSSSGSAAERFTHHRLAGALRAIPSTG